MNTITADGDVSVIDVTSQETKRSDVPPARVDGCWIPSGKRFQLFTSSNLDEESDGWDIVDDRYAGVFRRIAEGVSGQSLADTLDARKGRTTRSRATTSRATQATTNPLGSRQRGVHRRRRDRLHLRGRLARRRRQGRPALRARRHRGVRTLPSRPTTSGSAAWSATPRRRTRSRSRHGPSPCCGLPLLDELKSDGGALMITPRGSSRRRAATRASQIDSARRWTYMTFPHEQPEAVSRCQWARQLTRQEIAEGVRQTLPLRVRLVAPVTLDELREPAPLADAIAAAA